MDLISLLVIIIVFAVILWAVNAYIPMQPPLKTIVNVIIILIFVIVLLNGIGVLGEGGLYIGHHH